MEEKKLKDLKNKSFDSIQKMFDRAFKRVNTFVDFRTDLVEAELQSLMEVIPDEEEIAIDVVPLATKSLQIIYMLVEKIYPLTPPTIQNMAEQEVFRCQETMGDTIAQTRFEHVSKLSNDSLLANLQQRVLDLEKTKTTQQNEITSLKRVKKLEQKKRSRTPGLKRLHKVGMSRRVVFADNEESLANECKKLKLVDEVTLAQALEALKSVKPKLKGDVIKEPNVPVNVASASTKISAAKTTTATIPTPRKGIVITELEPKHVKKMSKKDQLRGDEEEAKRLQAKFDEEERHAREKDEANVALTEEWEDI
ncbi:hypothetical protein Tco_0392656 [Tanacetum coccineum]